MAEDEKISHKCVLCDRILESKDALQLHFRKHANKEIDNKGIPAKSKVVKRSIKREVPEPKNGKITQCVACDVCGQEFARNTLAIQHKFRKHPEVSAKYFCPYCGMQFTIKALFDKHVGTHGSDARHKDSINCEDCGAEFYFQAAKDYHHKSTHKRVMTIFQPVTTAPPSKKIKINNAGEIQSVYYCHLCGSEYILKFNLQKHLEKAHSEKERCTMPQDLIRCTTCDALFYNQKAYETHNIRHKPDDLYVTSEQQRLQTVSRVDQDFDIRRVLPLAVKYIPAFKNKPKNSSHGVVKDNDYSRFDKEDEELSPPSSPPESSDSDSDSDVPLVRLAQKRRASRKSESDEESDESKFTDSKQTPV